MPADWDDFEKKFDDDFKRLRENTHSRLNSDSSLCDQGYEAWCDDDFSDAVHSGISVVAIIGIGFVVLIVVAVLVVICCCCGRRRRGQVIRTAAPTTTVTATTTAVTQPPPTGPTPAQPTNYPLQPTTHYPPPQQGYPPQQG